jgi:hypothetical protein
MMGRLNHDQEQFFYSFRLDEAVPQDHPVRAVAAVLDLSWVHSEETAREIFLSGDKTQKYFSGQ